MMGSEKDQEKIDEEADKSENRLKYGAIAAVNKVSSRVEEKQEQLVTSEGDVISSGVYDHNGFLEFIDYVQSGVGGGSEGNDELVSARGVANEIISVKNTIDSKRVEIYTTWDDDDVAEVPLVTASGQ